MRVEMLTKSPGLALTLILALTGAFAGCSGDGDEGQDNPFGVTSTTVTSAENPVALTFAPDGRLFFAEKYAGRIRVVDSSGKLVPEPFVDIDVANWLNLDWGLTGLALDPDFETNGYLYAFYTEVFTPSDTMPIARPVLVRYTDRNNRGTDPTVLISDLPPTRLNYQGYKGSGAIHFGADGALYITMGDYDWNKSGPNGTGASQDLSVPMGKVLRVSASGDALSDNPFASDPTVDSRIFASGFNQGSAFAFHPDSGGLYTTDGTGSCEELDIVVSGADYGWPDVGEFPFSDCYFGDQADPIYLFGKGTSKPGEFLSGPGVSGLAFVSGTEYVTLGDGLLVCEAQTGLMRRLSLAPPTYNQVTANDVVVEDCQADVAIAPDGTVYYSNRVEIKRLNRPSATPTATP